MEPNRTMRNERQGEQPVQSLEPYLKQMNRAAVRRALLWGLSLGLAAFAVAELICKWRLTDRLLWPCLCGAGGLILGAFIAWIKLRPSVRHTAERLDALGLQERAATMLALQNDDSEIARLQRADALQHIRPINAEGLHEKHGPLLTILCGIALLLAVGSLMLPKSWFEKPVDPQKLALQQAIDLLEEERQALLEQDETALAEEMAELIESLSETDSAMEAASRISETEQAVQEAAESGEASEAAAQEAQEALAQAKEQVMSAESAEDSEPSESSEESGESEASESEESEAPEGSNEESEESGEEGEEASGAPGAEGEPSEVAAGAMPGEIPGMGTTPQGQSMGGSGNAIPSSMTEPVYDPISGAVQYGEVYAAYYAEYLQEARDGAVTSDIQQAADAYFDSLNQ